MALPANPPIDYTARSYPEILDWLMNGLVPRFVPEWTDRSDSDMGVVLVQLLAAMADGQAFYVDRAAGQHMPGHITEMAPALAHARLLGYTPRSNTAADVVLRFTARDSVTSTQVLETGVRVSGGGLFFETTESKTFPFTTLSQDTDGESDLLFVSSLLGFEVGDEVTISSGALAQETYEILEVNTLLSALRLSDIPTEGFLVSDGATARMKSGLVAAREGTTIANELLGTSNGLAGQRYLLRRAPFIQDSETITVDEGAGLVAYIRSSSLIDVEPTERHYEIRADSQNRRVITFGDGTNGFIPPTSSQIYATYRIGGGESANFLPAGAITGLVLAPTWIESVTNPESPEGGVTEESIDTILANASRSIRTNDRAVSAADFEDMARQVPGVAQAKAVPYEGGWARVALHVAPLSGETPSDTLMAQVAAAIEPKMLMLHDLIVLPPNYVEVDIAITVNVGEHFLAANVKAAVEAVGRAYMGIGTRSFGETLYRSDLTGEIEGVNGVENLVYNTFTKYPVPEVVALSGNPTFGPITVGSSVKTETWTVTMTTSTAFEVEGSVSGVIGSGTFGTPFSVAGVLGFTITAGSIAAQAGNSWEFDTAAYESQAISLGATQLAVPGTLTVTVVGGQ